MLAAKIDVPAGIRPEVAVSKLTAAALQMPPLAFTVSPFAAFSVALEAGASLRS